MKISRKQLNILVEKVLVETKLAYDTVDKTTITDPEAFRDPEIVMAQFHKLMSAAGNTWDNTKVIESWLEELESRIIDLENRAYEEDT